MSSPAEVTPLMIAAGAGQSVSPHSLSSNLGSQEADVLLLLKSPYSKDNIDNDKIMKPSRLEAWWDRIALVEEDRFSEALPKLNALLKSSDEQGHPLRECRKAFLEDLCCWLPSLGFTVRLFLSRCEKTIFLRVSVDPGEVEEALADMSHLRLQTTTDLIEALGVKQDLNQVNPAYMMYRRHQLRRFSTEKGPDVQVFQRYMGKHQRYGSILRSVDRIRLIYSYLNEVIDLESCGNMRLMKGHYPVHEQRAVSSFRTDWARFELLFLSWSQPITRLRDYFGEPIAFYYAWLGFICKGVFLLALVAVCLWTSQVVMQYPLEIMMAVWCPVVVVWDTAWNLLWRRKQNFYSECWDMNNFFEHLEVRPRWRSYPQKSQIHADEQDRYYPHWKVVVLKWIGWAITFICIAVVIVGVFFVYHLAKHWLDLSIGRYGYQVSRSCFTGLCMSLLNRGWRYVAPHLVDWANPRTMAEYRSALWAKLMAFQAVNSYWSMMFLSYNHAFTEADDDPVIQERRMERLQWYIFTTFISMAACDIGLGLIYWYRLLDKVRRQDKRDDRRSREAEDECVTPSKKDTHLRKCYMEAQASLDDYTADLEVLDSVDTVVTVGYILLFGVISPILVVACFLSLMIKMRLSSWYLCCLYRRPYPWRATGLCVAQREVLHCLAWLGMVNSIALPLFNLNRFRQYSRPALWCIFFVAEHLLIALKLMVSRWLYASSSYEELVRKQRERVTEEWMDAQVGKKQMVDIKKSPVNCKEIDIRPIHQYSPEWNQLQSEDTKPGMSCAEVPASASFSEEAHFDKKARFGVEIQDPLGVELI